MDFKCPFFSQDPKMIHDYPHQEQKERGPAANHDAGSNNCDRKRDPLRIAGDFVQPYNDRL